MVQYCMTCGTMKNSNNYEQCNNCSDGNYIIRAFNPYTGKVLLNPYNYGDESSISSYDEIINLYLTTNMYGYKCYSNKIFDKYNSGKPEINEIINRDSDNQSQGVNYLFFNTFIDKNNPWIKLT